MAIEYTTWNPSDKHANITLTNENLTAEVVNANYFYGVRATVSKIAGKWYWEETVDVDTKRRCLGIGTVDAVLSPQVGSNAYGYGYHSDGNKWHSGSGSVYGNTYTVGDVIGIALDLDNGKIWFSKNGVWQNSGDPVAGTGEAFSGISGIYFPMTSLGYVGDKDTVNFGASAFSYSVPSGFNSGLYSGTEAVFTFSNPIPVHLSTVYGATKQLQLTTTVSGSESNYTYDATFYSDSDVQIGSTVSGVNSGISATSNAHLPTPSGIDYSWYVIATSSGGEDTSSTYTFSKRFLYEGYVTENDNPVNRMVRLYYRNTGELIDSTTSSGSNGYYSLDALVNDEHFIVAFDDEVGEDYNALILDRVLPNGEE